MLDSVPGTMTLRPFYCVEYVLAGLKIQYVSVM